MEILYILLILLVLTRSFGELAVRVKQPPLTGELVAGILLGLVIKNFPDFFPILTNLTHNEVFTAVTDLGIFFLMLLGGLELQPKEIIETSGKSLIVASCAMILPLALGTGVAWIFLPESDYKIAQAVFVGTGLAITAVPVAIRVLMDLNKLNSPIGRLIVSSAVVDDILSLILLAALTALIKTGGFPSITGFVVLIGQIILFFIITALLGSYILPLLGRWIYKYLTLEELEFSYLLIVALGFAVLAEVLNMHFIIGAFVAGLFFSQRTINIKIYRDVKNKVSGITTGFLAPVFFASIGLHLDLAALVSIPFFLIILIIIAFLSKFIGAAVPTRLIGFNRQEANIVGVAMSARGAVELVIANIALEAGLFLHPQTQPPVIKYMFSAIVIVAVVTTLLVPIILERIVKSK